MTGAPLMFLLAVIAAGAIIYFIVKGHFSQEIKALTATVAHKQSVLDDYRDRLNGHTPLEVANEINGLKALVDELKRKVARPQRVLTSEQKDKIAELAANSGLVGHYITVCATPDTESNRYAKQIVAAFEASGVHCGYNPLGTHDEGEAGVILYSPEKVADPLFCKVGEIFSDINIPFKSAISVDDTMFHYIFVCPEEE